MNIVIRADASTKIGTGHVMRCLALAQAWQQEGGEVVFVMGTESSALEARLQAENIKVFYLAVSLGSTEDAIATVKIAQQVKANWIVVDGYQFGALYQQSIKDAGFKLLFFDDDGHAEYYYADLVLNQNINAYADLYVRREPYTQLLLGTEYTLLRKEFWIWQGWKRQILPVARKVLVTLGGSDPDNVTLTVMQALQQVEIDGIEVIVVVGGSNPYYDRLQAATQSSGCKISLKQNVSNMPELMAWADVAIAAGGSTNWELAFMGLPSLIISLADNQKALAAELDTQGIVSHLGWHQQIDSPEITQAINKIALDCPKRERMSQAGQKLIDGNGGKRIVAYSLNSDHCRIEHTLKL